MRTLLAESVSVMPAWVLGIVFVLIWASGFLSGWNAKKSRKP